MLLRWCVQRGIVALPKSVTPARIRENIAPEIFAIVLDEDDLASIATLEDGTRFVAIYNHKTRPCN